MQISFYLDKPNAARSIVMLNVTLLGKRLRFTTGLSLEPKHWNKAKQEPRTSDPHRNMNLRKLTVIESAVKNLYTDMSVGGKKHLIENDEISRFRERVKTFLTPEPEELPNQNEFVVGFEEFVRTYTIRSSTGLITNRRPNDSTIQKYQHVLSTLEDWSVASHTPLSYSIITIDFYLKYTAWLVETRKVSDPTASNYIKVLKTFLKWARQKGYHNITEYEQFYRDRRTSDTIALTVDELRQIRDVDLTDHPRLSRVRDHFLLQCYTGMRYGDLLRLEPKHFDEQVGVIRFATQKTDTRCIVSTPPSTS